MEANPLMFTHNGVNYRISSHIWAAHRERVGLITVAHIRSAISEPDFQQDESDKIRLYWKWFPDIGSGNYLKVVVNISLNPHLVVTAHPDEDQRKRKGRQ